MPDLFVYSICQKVFWLAPHRFLTPGLDVRWYEVQDTMTDASAPVLCSVYPEFKVKLTLILPFLFFIPHIYFTPISTSHYSSFCSFTIKPLDDCSPQSLLYLLTPLLSTNLSFLHTSYHPNPPWSLPLVIHVHPLQWPHTASVPAFSFPFTVLLILIPPFYPSLPFILSFSVTLPPPSSPVPLSAG